MDTVANLQKSVDSQSQTNAVQNVLDESVKAEDVVHEDEVRYARALSWLWQALLRFKWKS